MGYEINFEMLKQIYSNSAISVGVIDTFNNELWGNTEFNRLFNIKNDTDNAILLSEFQIKMGSYVKIINEAAYSVNIIPLNGYDIVEVMPTASFEEVFSLPEARDFLQFVFLQIRTSVGEIAKNTDEIFDEINKNKSLNSVLLSNKLNNVDIIGQRLLAGILDAEQATRLSMPDFSGEIFNVAKAVTNVAETLCANLEKFVDIQLYISPEIYAVMNATIFELLLADILGKCCSNRFCPDTIMLSLSKTADTHATLVLHCDYKSRIPFDERPSPININPFSLKYNDYFFELNMKKFCSQFDGEYKEKFYDDIAMYTLRFATVPSPPKIFRSATAEQVFKTQSVPVNLRLRDSINCNKYDVNNKGENEYD